MTALNSAILFNNSTGSDTTASGSSAGVNVYGSGASTTSASAVVTGITTTGVQAGDLLWVQSSSGRQFSVIASVDSGTQVTCDDTFANTESSRTWAIGGKRATFDNADSRSLWNDFHAGWTIKTETDQTVSSPISGSATGSRTSYATIDLGGNTVTMTSSSNDVFTLREHVELKNGSIVTTAGTAGRGVRIDTNTNFLYARCIDLTVDGFYQNFSWNAAYLSIKRCKSLNATLDGLSGYQGGLSAYGCLIDNSTRYGIVQSQSASFFIDSCVISNSQNRGVYATHVGRHSFVSNVFYSNAGNAIDTQGAISQLTKNIFVNNGAYAIYDAEVRDFEGQADNVFYNNTSGSYSSTHLQSDTDITLTADPFVDAAGGDFNINADSGGGATLRANNFALNNDTALYPFRQYVSDDFDSGAGGGNVIVIED